MTDERLERLQSVRVTPVRLCDGYAMGDVDQLLEVMADAVRNGGPLRPLRGSAMLTRVRFRETYDIPEVDAFLDSIAGAPGTPTSGTPTSGTPTSGTPTSGTPTSGTPTSDGPPTEEAV